jgi:hypothetical protein
MHWTQVKIAKARVADGIAAAVHQRHTGNGGSATMADPEEKPVMLPFADKTGTGWHVVIRYHEGHERRIDGFASEREAIDWIVANAPQVDE